MKANFTKSLTLRCIIIAISFLMSFAVYAQPACTSFTSGTVSSVGTILMDVNGTTACTGYDQIQLTGTANAVLGGNLTISLGSFTPTIGNTFILIDNVSSSGTITGTFSSVTLPKDPAYAWELTYPTGSGDLILKVIAPCTIQNIQTNYCANDPASVININPALSFTSSIWTITPGAGASGFNPNSSGSGTATIAPLNLTSGTTYDIDFTGISGTNPVSYCYAKKTINIKPIPNASDQVLTQCETTPGLGTAQYDLSTAMVTSATGVTISYHNNLTDAKANSSPLPTLFTPSAASFASGSLDRYARITDNTTGCYNTAKIVLRLNGKPIIANGPASPHVVCSGVAVGGPTYQTNTNSGSYYAVIGAISYTISALPIGGLTQTAGASTLNDMTDDIFVNTTNASVNMTYTVTPTSAPGCDGVEFTYTVKVEPKPSISNVVTSTNGYNETMTSGGNYSHTTCSNEEVTTSVPSLIPSLATACGTLRIQTVYTSTLPNIPSATVDATYAQALAAGSTTISPQNLTNSTQSITFVTTPYYDVDNSGSLTSGDVTGEVTTFVLTILPEPNPISTSTVQKCSGSDVNIDLDNFINNNGTDLGQVTYSWPAPDVTPLALLIPAPALGSLSSGDMGILHGAYVNPLTIPLTITYTITPTGGNGCVGTPFEVKIIINPNPQVNINPNGLDALCENDTRVVFGQVLPSGTYNYKWKVITDNANSDPTILSPDNAISPTMNVSSDIATDGGNLKIRFIARNNATTCADSVEYTFTVNEKPNVDAIPAGKIEACEDPAGSDNGLFNLTTGHTTTTPSTATVTYHISASDANAGIGAIPTSQITSFNGTDQQTIWVRASSGACFDVASFILDVLPTPVFTFTVVNAACNGGNGTITVVAVGATEYSKDNGTSWQTSSMFTVPVGNYQLKAKSAACVSDAQVAVVGEPTAIAATTVNVNPSCNGVGDGSVTVTASGGVGPYMYKLNSDAYGTSNSFIGMSAGAYTITVKDANNCEKVVTGNLVSPNAIVFGTPTATGTNPSCNGGSNGSIALTTSTTGGTSPVVLSYAWTMGTSSTVISTLEDPSGLVAGTYNVTITATDGNGCIKTTTASATLTDPAAVVVTGVVVNALCNGGIGTVTLSGATTYTSATGSITGNVFTAPAGTYVITGTTAAGCTDTATFTITEPTDLVLNGTVTNPLCYGNTGSVALTGSGGTPAYTFTSSTGTVSGATMTANAGTHKVLLTDANGCKDSMNFVITQPDLLVLAKVDTLNPSCNGVNDGSVTVTSSGGVGPYMYKLNSGSYGVSNIFTGMSGGAYTITVKDANNCEKMVSGSLSSPLAIAFGTTSAVGANPICNGGSTGSIDLSTSATGGTSPVVLSYAWTMGTSSTVISTLEDPSGLVAGTYNVTITATDGNGCIKTTTSSVTLTNPAAVVISGVVANASCNGGMGTVTLSGATSYTSATGSISGNVFTAPAGTYVITGTNTVGCTDTATFTITEPTELVLNGVVSNPLCYSNTGTVALTGSGGTPTYTFTSSTGTVSGANMTAIAGTHKVILTDANGCKDSMNFVITQPAQITAAINTNGDDQLCEGESRPLTSTLVPSAIYTYQWNLISPTAGTTLKTPTTNDNVSFNPGAPGINKVELVVTNSSNCVVKDTITFNINANPVAGASASDTEVCGGDEVTLTATGGGTYLWNTPTNATTAVTTVNPLVSTGYQVTVTNTAGCTDVASVAVNVTFTPTSPEVTDASVCAGATTANITAVCELPPPFVPVATTLTGAPGAVPDEDCMTSVINSSLLGSLGTNYTIDNVSLNITHTWNNDLDITLIAPNAVMIDLSSDNGGNQNGYLNTIFKTGGAVLPTTNTVITGIFAPEQPFSGLIGSMMTGNWTLKVCDDTGGDVGDLTVWSISFAPITTPTPSCTVKWYDSFVGGILVGTGSPFNPMTIASGNPGYVNPNPSTTTVSNFYAACECDGCPSTRSLATVTVNPNPATLITITPAGQFCEFASPVNLQATPSGGSWSGPGITNSNTGAFDPNMAYIAAGNGPGTENATVTYAYTDGNGCSATKDMVITINEDTTPPVIANCPANTTVSVAPEACIYTYNIPVPTATDECVLLSFTNNVLSAYTPGGYNLLYTAKDKSGNISNCTFSLTVVDDTDPLVGGCPSPIVDITLDNECSKAISYTSPFATDQCIIASWVLTFENGTPAPASLPSSTPTILSSTLALPVTHTFQLGQTIVKYTATDGAGNTKVCQFTVTLTEDDKPTFMDLADKTITTSIDNSSCPLNATVSIDLGVITQGSSYMVGGVSFTAPHLESAFSATMAGYTAGGFADACDTAPELELESKTFDNTDPCSTTWTLVWKVTDNYGNFAKNDQVIIIKDDTAPTFTKPADVTIYADASCGYDADTLKTGTVSNEADNCSTGINATYSDVVANGTCQGNKVITRTWTLVDKCGNVAASQMQIITVQDTLDPTFTKPADVTIYADASCGYDADTLKTGAVTNEADNCSTGLVATYSDAVANGTCEGNKVITRTWSLIDKCGNAAMNQIQTITVLDTLDPTPICPTTQVVINLSAIGMATLAADALAAANSTDNCSVLLTQTSPSKNYTCDSVGNRIVLLTATDACGNSATVSCTVIVKDVTPPVALCKKDTVYVNQAGNASNAAADIDNGSNDACGVSTLASSQTTFNCGNLGNVNVILTVTDVNGNSSTCSTTVTVIDNLKPKFDPTDTLCGGMDTLPTSPLFCFAEYKNVFVKQMTDNCTGNNNLVVTASALFASGQSTSMTVVPVTGGGYHISIPSSLGNSLPTGLNKITIVAKDQSGNTDTCKWTVLVKDIWKPSLNNCPANITVAVNPATCTGIGLWAVPTASDNCTGVSLTNNGQTPSNPNGYISGQAFPLGITNIVYTATDGSGNTATCSFTINVTGACNNNADLTPSISQPVLTGFSLNQERDFVIKMENISANPTNGQTIQFFVPFSSGYTFTFDPAQTSSTSIFGTQTVNNTNWTMIPLGAGMLFSSTVNIPGNSVNKIAINVKAITGMSVGLVNAILLPGSGGDTTAGNNSGSIGILTN